MLRYSLAILIGFVLAVLGQSNFSNPVIYEDFADNDIFRGPDNVFYYSASNMHYSPGAPILQSYDLVNWQLIGHSVPSLNFGSQYNMTGNQTAYTQGTWASTLRYRESSSQWYWIGCVNFWTTYVFTASSPTGPWTQSASFQPCFYDCGLMIDDDDTMYVVYGSNNVSIAQLSSDGLSVLKTQPVFNYPSQCTGMEGNRLYKRNGTYYVLDDCPSEGITVIWQSSSIWGPWTDKILIDGISSPVPSGGSPDQGSLIETQNGDWYYMSFTWAYPAGRMPILAPITWGSDGFPVLTEVDGGWGASYQYPLTPQSMPSWTGTDTFQGTSLGAAWEWNHNPDSTKYVVNNGLTLYTVTVTDDLYHARNTLTHRVNGQFPVGTVEVDFSNMADGDTCGLAAFRDQSAWIGIVRSGSTYTVTAVQGLTQDSSNSWATTSTGSVVGTAQISQTKVWLRVSMDARASGSKLANFFYSTDGLNFNQLGGSFTMATGWQYFMGYRFGIFNFATKALGGSISVVSFDSDDASSGPTSVTAVPTTATATTTTTSTSTTTTSLSQITTMATTTTTTAPSGNASAQSEWGQCGGTGWTGPTSCQSPYACHTQNAYYAQCL